MNSLIRVENLEKSYKSSKAVNGISFEVRKGEILCFLGPNGAGKSTTINILSTALGCDRGEIFFKGEKVEKNVNRLKASLGIVPQELAVYEGLSAQDNVRFFASLYGLRGKELKKRTEEALRFVGLSEKRKDKVNTFSGGMKRRLNIACAIAHNPEVIIMDEPTVGIDPQSRNHILSSIRELKERGATIIYTTHYMEEVEEISTRIIIMDYGVIIAEGTKEQLKERLGDEKLYTVEVEDLMELKRDEFFRIEGVKNVEMKDGTIRISTLRGIENLDKLISVILNGGLKITNLTSMAASLETVFLKLTGRTLRD